MVFDPKKFFAPGGGTKIITKPEEKKKAFEEIVERGGTTGRRSSSGGSSGGSSSGGASSGNAARAAAARQQAAAQAAAQAAQQEAARQQAAKVEAARQIEQKRVAAVETQKNLEKTKVLRDRKIIRTANVQAGDIRVKESIPIKYNIPIPSGPKKRRTFKERIGKADAAVSKKLYKITGFSKEQGEKQKRDLIETTAGMGRLNKRLYGVEQTIISEAIIKPFTNIIPATDKNKALLSIAEQTIPAFIAKPGYAMRQGFIATGGAVTGAVGTIGQKTIDEPVSQTGKYVALGAAGYGVGLGLAGLGYIGTTTGVTTAITSGAFAGGTSSLIIPAAQVAAGSLGIAFIAKKGIEVYEAPNIFEKGGIIGETLLETTAVAGGVISGQQDAVKIGDIIRTRGRTEVPVEEFVIPNVLSGKTKFVESKSYGYQGPRKGQVTRKQKFDLNIFENSPTTSHVTPDKFWKDTITTAKSSSEFPGLYTAPSSSVHFAKTGGSNSKISLVGTGNINAGKPAVAQFSSLKFTTSQSGSKAFITGVKPEIEAVIPVGQEFSKMIPSIASGGKGSFFKFSGRRIPVDLFGASTTGAPTSSIGTIGTSGAGLFSSAASSSSASFIPSYSIVNPISISVAGVASSYRNSIQDTSPTFNFSKNNYSITSTTTKPTYTSYLVPPQSEPTISSPTYTPSSPRPSRNRGGGGSSYITPSYPSPVPPSPSPPIPVPSGGGSSGNDITPPVYVPSGGSSGGYTDLTSSVNTYNKPLAPFKMKQPSFRKQFGSFGVSIRRGGKFFNVGSFKTQKLAFARGKSLTSSTLAATFKLSGIGKLPKAPKGFYTKRGGDSILFIEKRGKRLSKKSETKEITAAKKKKAKPRKKKK